MQLDERGNQTCHLNIVKQRPVPWEGLAYALTLQITRTCVWALEIEKSGNASRPVVALNELLDLVGGAETSSPQGVTVCASTCSTG